MYRFYVTVSCAVVAFAMTFASAGDGDSSAEPPEVKKGTEIVECQIFLETRVGLLELKIQEPKIIKEIIEDPVKNARDDPDPAKYKILGRVSMKRSDGSEDGFVLFWPWGHFVQNKKFRIADFGGIHRVLKEALTDVIEKTSSPSDSGKKD